MLKKPTNPKLGLKRIKNLLKAIGFDRNAMKIIQVVGTNGKGSTVAFIESILLSHKIATGLFTSPHLCSARERIRINGQMVSPEQFSKAAQLVLQKDQALEDESSFFECILAMALWLFQKNAVQVAILEAGIGGRLDATTAVFADILGVTSIDIDHQAILGETLDEIAQEKIMAAYSGQNVVTVAQKQPAHDAILRAKKELGFKLIQAPLCKKPLGLFGHHQQANAGLALALVQELSLELNEQKTEQGLLQINWPGRFEIIPHEVDWVLDGAHNPAGILSLIHSLQEHARFLNRPVVVVYGSLKGEQAKNKIEILLKSGLKIEAIFIHQPENTRALAIDELKTLFLKTDPKAKVFAFTALSEVINQAKNLNAVVVVCGSLYTVGALRSLLLSIEMDPKAPSF